MTDPPRRSRVWGVARNLVSLLSSDVVTRATSFVVYALVGRNLGTLEFGQLLLAVSLFQMFGRLSSLGLQDLVTRTVAKDRGSTSTIVGHASLLIVGATVLAGLALVAVVSIFQYSEDTTRVILVMFVGLLPFGLTRVTEAAFIGWERAGRIAWVNIPVNLLQTAIATWLIMGGYPVVWVALSIGVAYVAMAAIQWVLFRRMVEPTGQGLRLQVAWDLLKETMPFFGMEAAFAITSSITILLLSKFVDEVGVGTFSAATQLIVPVALVTQTVGTVMLPVMVRRARRSLGSLRGTTIRAMEAMMLVVLPAVVLYFAMGDLLLGLVYGQDDGFEQSRTVLQIVSFKPIELGIAAILGRALLTLGGEKTLFRILVIRSISSFFVAWGFISLFGITGAAIAVVVNSAVNVVLHYVPASRSMQGLRLLPAFARPLLGAMAMAGVLLVSGGLNDVVRVLASSAAYVVVAGLAIQLSPGGFGRFRDLDPAPDR